MLPDILNIFDGNRSEHTQLNCLNKPVLNHRSDRQLHRNWM